MKLNGRLSFFLVCGVLILSACNNGGENTSSSTPDERWRPVVSDTWQWQLTGALNITYDVDVYDIDLFDNPSEKIRQLKAAGHRVVCYFSAGSYENYRPDAADFDSADLGETMDGWPDERWLDIRSNSVRAIMTNRLDLALEKGCDGVEPDNVDGYANDTGFLLTPADQLEYNLFLAQEAHQRNLAVGLKNDLDQVAALVDDFDFAVNEQCHEYDECDLLLDFIDSGKPVFNAEYADDYVNDNTLRQALCQEATDDNLRTLVLPLDLDDSFRYSCD